MYNTIQTFEANPSVLTKAFTAEGITGLTVDSVSPAAYSAIGNAVPAPPPPPPASVPKKKKNNTGLIVGIVVGVTVGVLAIIALVVVLAKKGSSNTAQTVLASK